MLYILYSRIRGVRKNCQTRHHIESGEKAVVRTEILRGSYPVYIIEILYNTMRLSGNSLIGQAYSIINSKLFIIVADCSNNNDNKLLVLYKCPQYMITIILVQLIIIIAKITVDKFNT